MIDLRAFNEHFPDEDSCRQFIIQERWDGTPVCPRCKKGRGWEMRDGMGYRCSVCKRPFSVRTSTAMEGSRLPLRIWLMAFHVLAEATEPFTNLQLARMLGVSPRAARFMQKRIEEACAQCKLPWEELRQEQASQGSSDDSYREVYRLLLIFFLCAGGVKRKKEDC